MQHGGDIAAAASEQQIMISLFQRKLMETFMILENSQKATTGQDHVKLKVTHSHEEPR